MKFKTRKTSDVVVYDLKGGLEGGPDTYAIKDHVKGLIDEGERKFLINMDKVDYVNSTGIGIITGIYSSITNNGGKLKICNANSKVSRVMMITKLLEIFDSYYEEDDALKAFGEG